MSERITIRRARLEDAERIVELWMAMMHEHEGFERHVQLSPDAARAYHQYASHHIHQKDSIVVVAENEKQIVGFCLAFKTQNLPMFLPESYGYLSDIAVQPDTQQKGIGQAMFKRVSSWFHHRGIQNMQLQVYYRNQMGRKFWEKTGFDNFVNGLWYDVP